MDALKKKRLIGFICGGLFGLVTYLIVDNIPDSLYFLAIPFLIGLKIGDIILWPVCHFSKTDICRGLAFDGGPLEWVEWTSMIGGGILIYALMFWIIIRLIEVIRNKFSKQTQS
ncbi:MAG: hypothetical protein KA052_02750 [Candidatus Pacebacteria bacterium]|nr:hypothetical protein [Candidatus Paceibacterota bacterium]